MRTSIFDGMDTTVLQTRLQALQQAYLDISQGTKVEVASYAQADGSRTVTYSKANLADLTAVIITVQTAIDRASGLRINRRRPLSPIFGR